MQRRAPALLAGTVVVSASKLSPLENGKWILIKRILVMLAGTVLAFTATVHPAGATVQPPAVAFTAVTDYRVMEKLSPIQGCQDGWVCFYADDQFGGGRYGFHVQNLYGGTCWSFPWGGQTGWPGGAVANQISSSMINRAAVTGAPAHYLHYSDDNYCSTTTGYGSVSVQIAQNSVNYITSMTQFFGSQWNDRVGSVWYT